MRINDFTYSDAKGKEYILVRLDFTEKENEKKDDDCYYDARTPVCSPSYGDWMPTSPCTIQLFKKPLYKNDNTGKIDLVYTLTEKQYEIVAAHEFGHAFGLADFLVITSENEDEYIIEQAKISPEIPKYSIMRLRATQTNDFVKYNTHVWANDIEMILEAFHTVRRDEQYQGAFDGPLINASKVVKFDKRGVTVHEKKGV